MQYRFSVDRICTLPTGPRSVKLDSSLDALAGVVVQTPDEVLAQQGGTLTGFLEHMDLRGANLRETRFAGMRMQRLGLRGARLDAATLENTELLGCDLQRAHLSGGSIHGGRLEICDLSRLVGQGLKLRGTTLLDCRFGSADLTGSRWRDVVVEGGETSYLRLDQALLMRVRFHHPRLGGSPLMRTRLVGTFLIECDLQAVNFYAADLRGAVFMRTNLSDAVFHDADLTDAVFIDCNTARTDWTGAVGTPRRFSNGRA